MSEYTSTREGFQAALEMVLAGPPEHARGCVEKVFTPRFYQIFNGERKDMNEYVDGITEMRRKTSNLKVKVGDQLAAHLDGAFSIDGASSVDASLIGDQSPQSWDQ
ncbi:hypothetical protein B0I35DRAFT_405004 [Stachybotrys elegans]|uniref:Uncharacterized protein n=1 Tax=Stachybotrys elegans TaxID=80388 RepID=A0A8K0T261_9HYPO|nr:hypothetical protein B0I35DRAFT_405004 [Stachybotrys elegans]